MPSSANKNQGLLISFDGIDSSGKETQANLLMQRLRQTGQVVGFFQTPDYNTASGMKLKRLFQGQDGSWDNLTWPEKMALIASNRAEHKTEVIKILQQGGVVIYDRYVPSSVAHMTVDALKPNATDRDRQIIREQVEKHEYDSNQMPHEDLSIFLDITPHKAAELLLARKKLLAEADETTDQLDLQQRIYQEYHQLIKDYPDHYLRINCCNNNKLIDIDTVASKVWQEVTRRFPNL